MKYPVLLSLRGKQTYANQEPDLIELVTEGTLEEKDEAWEIVYEETALTGLEGVKTIFRVEPKKIYLTRTGKLRSHMLFQEGTTHDSLYQMEFGAMMISVSATKVEWSLSREGGVIDLVYGIELEHSDVGVIEYHLDITAK